jgi:hypothetical protein
MSNELNEYQITAVVNALVGSITPIGDECVDAVRRENQNILFGVIENLIWQVWKNLKYMDRRESSMFRIGYDAEKFLGYLVKEYELNNCIEEEEE